MKPPTFLISMTAPLDVIFETIVQLIFCVHVSVNRTDQCLSMCCKVMERNKHGLFAIMFEWTLVVLCYSARPCYDILTCCAPVKWTLSQIYEASSVALVSPLICALLFEQISLHACPQNTVPLKAWILPCTMRDKKREGHLDPMIDLDYAQPMWPSVARLLDDSSKVLQFCTSRPIHLNWIVELLAKPGLKTYLIADSVEVCCSPKPTCLMNVWGCFQT